MGTDAHRAGTASRALHPLSQPHSGIVNCCPCEGATCSCCHLRHGEADRSDHEWVQGKPSQIRPVRQGTVLPTRLAHLQRRATQLLAGYNSRKRGTRRDVPVSCSLHHAEERWLTSRRALERRRCGFIPSPIPSARCLFSRPASATPHPP